LLRFSEEERPLGLQIFGEHEENLVKACRVVENMKADFVDLNLGCPVPKIVNKGAGSAMCRRPAELGKILTAMVKSVKIPVTIKIRTGWDQSLRNAQEIVQVATDAGVAWVAIHGRTRAQGYSGDADWDFIGEVKAKSKLPIIGNGDVVTPEAAVSRYKTYGVDAVMIGRGALRNPFLFEQSADLLAGREMKSVTSDRIVELLRKQKGYLHGTFEGKSAMLHARKFLAWYSSGYPGSADFRKRVFQIQEENALWSDAEAFFELSLRKRDMTFLSEPFLMGGHG
jgi:nifR3 family TIM-barrel protein